MSMQDLATSPRHDFGTPIPAGAALKFVPAKDEGWPWDGCPQCGRPPGYAHNGACSVYAG